MKTERDLAARRELLVLRAQLQRLQLQVQLHGLAQQMSPRGWATRAWEAARTHPSSWLVAMAALAAARRAGWRTLLDRGLVLWRAWEVARRWLRRRQTP